MPSYADKLKTALQEPFGQPVYYFASTETDPLREAAAGVRTALAAGGDADFTRLDGPVPDMGGAIAAAGAISFFGTPRVVELREISPSTMNDKDIEELAALFGQLENAVLLVTAVYKDKKTATGKKAKKLMDAATKAGFAVELAKPTRRENLQWLTARAAETGTSFAHGAAEALLDRAGEDRTLLRSETDKLAAMSGYETITVDLVEKHGALNIEADVFALSRSITAGRRAEAFEKLAELLAQRHEPIAVAAALSGSFVDMLRVRLGSERRLPVSTIFSEMGYRGNDFRLKKAKENASQYSTAQLADCVLCLYDLDRALKSSVLSDKTILLEAAVGELLVTLGARR